MLLLPCASLQETAQSLDTVSRRFLKHMEKACRKKNPQYTDERGEMQETAQKVVFTRQKEGAWYARSRARAKPRAPAASCRLFCRWCGGGVCGARALD